MMNPLEELPIEEVAPTDPGTPPATRLRQTFDYIKQKKLPEVAEALPDSYEDFEAGMEDPDNVKALHAVFKEQKWEGSELDDTKFADFVLAGVKKKAQSAPSSVGAGAISATAGPTTPALTAEDEAEQQMGAFVPAGPLTPQALDEEFALQPDGPAPVEAPAASMVPPEIPDEQQVPDGISLRQGVQKAPGDEYIEAGLPLPSGEVLRSEQERQDAANKDGFWATLGKSLYNTIGKPGLTRMLGNVVEQGGDMFTSLAAATYEGEHPGEQVAVSDDKPTDRFGAEWRALAKHYEVPVAGGARTSIIDEPTNPQAWAGMLGQGIGSIALVGAASALTGGTGAAAAGAGLSIDQTRETARAAGIPEQEAMLTATVLAPITGALEALGMGFVTKNPVARRLLQTEIIKRAVAYGEGKLAKATLVRAASEVLPEVVKRFGSRAVTGAVGEAGTEFLQGEAEGATQLAADAMRAPGEPGYGVTPMQALVKNPLQQAAAGFVLGGAGGGLHGLAEGAPTPTAVPLGESPTRGPLYAEFGPDRLTVRYLDAKGEEVDFGPAGPPPAVHQAVGAARVRAEQTAPPVSENPESVRENPQSVPETSENVVENPETAAALPIAQPETADVAGPPAGVEPGAAAGAVPEGAATPGEGAAPEIDAAEAPLPQSAPNPAEDIAQQVQPLPDTQPDPASVTTLTAEQQSGNAALDALDRYASLGKRAKKGAEGAAARAEVQRAAEAGGLTFEVGADFTATLTRAGNRVTRANEYTGTTPANNHVPLAERPEAARPFMERVVQAADGFPAVVQGLGIEMRGKALSGRELAAAVEDIKAGKNTMRAALVLDALENAHRRGYVEKSEGTGMATRKYAVPVDEYATGDGAAPTNPSERPAVPLSDAELDQLMATDPKVQQAVEDYIRPDGSVDYQKLADDERALPFLFDVTDESATKLAALARERAQQPAAPVPDPSTGDTQPSSPDAGTESGSQAPGPAPVDGTPPAGDAGASGGTEPGAVAESAPALRPTQVRLAALDSEYEKLKQELVAAKQGNAMQGQPLATLVPLATITPAEAAVYVKMITNRLQKGVVKVADILAELRTSLGSNLGAASDADLRTVIQYAKDERAEEADLTRAAVQQDLARRQTELEERLLGSATATDADFTATGAGKVTGAASRLQEKLISGPARALGAKLNELTSRAAVSKNAFARELVYAVNAVSKGFVQTRAQQLRSESFIGQARERPAKEAEVLYNGFTERLRDTTIADPVKQGEALRTSLRRIDRVLDPAFYEARTRDGFESLLQERLDPAEFAALDAAELDRLFAEHTSLLSAEQVAAAGSLEPDDLSDAEHAVYEDLKMLYSFVHDANFAIGRVSYNTWEAGRDMDTGEATYAARLYTSYELPDELAPAWQQAMGNGGRRMETGLYQQRQELEAWKLANKVEDPVFAAVKRLRQTMANRAIHDYGQWLASDQPHLVVQPAGPGVQAREAARQEGESRGFVQLGEGYGALSNAWVAPHVAEDFKGAFFTNKFMQRIFEITKAYGSGNTDEHLLAGSLGKVRNVLKKTVTVYNPGTHMGNILNNMTLGWFAGVDAVSMAAEQVGAVKELREYSPTVRFLLDRGVLGGSLATSEFKQNLADFSSAFAPEPPQGVVARGLGAMEKFYQDTDTVAKLALFRALVKQGLPAETAADRVATALQNNKRVGKAYDVGANVPVVGQAFVRWSADLARILASGAVNRPLSVAAFAVGLRVLGSALSKAAGETEAERKLREAGASRIPLPAFLGGNISTSLKVSKTSTVDFSRWFIPFYLYGGYDDDEVGGETLSKFAPIWLKGGGHFLSGEFGYTSNPAGARAVTLAKLAADPLIGPLTQLALDADFRGKSISDPNATTNSPSTATPLEKQAAQAHFFLRSALPGVGPLLDDVYQAARDRENYFGKKRSVGMTLARFLGFKAEQFGTEQYYKALVRTTLTAQRQMEAELKLAHQVPDDVLKGMLNHSVNIHQLVPRLRYRSDRFMDAYLKYSAAEQLAQDFLQQAAEKQAKAKPGSAAPR